MTVSFSRAAFNCFEKSVNLRQYNGFHSKNVLLRLAATARKKLGTKQKNLTLPLVVISPKLPLMFISILEKFRCFWESKRYGMEGKWQNSRTLGLPFNDRYFVAWLEEKSSVQSKIQVSRLVWCRSVLEDERNFSWRSEKNTVSSLLVWIEEQFELQRSILCKMKAQLEARIKVKMGAALDWHCGNSVANIVAHICLHSFRSLMILRLW